VKLEQAKEVTKLRQEVEQGAKELASKYERKMKVSFSANVAVAAVAVAAAAATAVVAAVVVAVLLVPLLCRHERKMKVNGA